jgi:hypothetical protein
MMVLKYGLLVITIIFSSFRSPQTVNYRQEFGSDYSWAVNCLQRNNTIIEKYARQFSIPAKELKAIVFPELIRYNTVYDAIEINSLKYLYVSEGKNYADFSVGYFQMKPSFAEMIEQDANTLLDAGVLQLSGMDKLKNTADTEANRKARVNRITNIEQQIIYLCVFYRICSAKFTAASFATVHHKLIFFATCYNAGYRRNYEKLVSLQSKKYFHTGKLWSNTHYNYAAISDYYFANE